MVSFFFVLLLPWSGLLSVVAVGGALDGEASFACSRVDEEASRAWRQVDWVTERDDGRRHVWSEGKKGAIRRALEAKREVKKDLKVFVYPFPPGLAASRNSYFASAFSALVTTKKVRLGEEAFDEKKRWTPTAAFASVEDQHLLGVRVHRELERFRTDDPAEADLFFIPSYHLRPTKSSRDAFCDDAVPKWLAHLGTFGRGVSYLRRHHGRDHFVVNGRGVHRVKPESAAAAEKKAQKESSSSSSSSLATTANFSWRSFLDCPHFATEVALRQVQVLLPEAQCPFARALGSLRPVPYPSRTLTSTLQRLGLAAKEEESLFAVERRRPMRAALAVKAGAVTGPQRGKERIPFRSVLQTQCQAWAKCDDVPFTSLEANPSRMFSARFAYANATFCLQPPGYSAARKGIVDSVLLGCIPVLFRNDSLLRSHHPMSLDDLLGGRPQVGRGDIVFDPVDQSDLWPWHWQWQSGASVTLDISAVDDTGLEALLNEIPDDQIALARRVINAHLGDFLWDDPTGGRGNPVARPLALDIALTQLHAAAKQRNPC